MAKGRLHRIHKGVYAVGHRALAPLALEAAALLACGAGSILSHRSAAAIWRIVERKGAPVDVTVVGRDCGKRDGIRHHRAVALDRHDVRRREQLPVTAPARTLLDLAGVLDGQRLERALNEALVLRLTSYDDLRAAIARSKGRRGAPALRALLDRSEGPGFTRSEAERRLLALLRAGDLPAPETNVRVEAYEVDVLWRSARLVVEVDGYAFHSTRAAFERDRERDADLQARGFRVLRVTWRQLVDEPEATVARIAGLLGAAAP